MNDITTSDTSMERRLTRLGDEIRENGSISEAVLEQLRTARAKESAIVTSTGRKTQSSLRTAYPVRRLAIVGSIAALVVLCLVMLITPRTLLAEVAKNVRGATTYTVQLKKWQKVGDTGRVEVLNAGKWYWRSPNAYRIETPGETSVLFRDKPGISWQTYSKKYWEEPAQQGYISPLLALQDLGDFAKDATQLGVKKVDGVDCPGFAIQLREIESSLGKGVATVWVNPSTKLPMRVVFPSNDSDGEFVFENFSWNVALDDSLFDTTPPGGYTRDEKRANRDIDAVVEKIVLALKHFSDMSGGEYPRVKVIYGDVVRDQMYEIAGYEKGDTREFLHEDNYVRICESSFGFAHMNQLMRENPDCRYRGLVVSRDDRDEVLFRWKLDDGMYQVIYGDLTSKRMSRVELPE